MADDLSNWIAAGAAGTAIVALALGEWRAMNARRDARERNLITWDLVWDHREGLRLVNMGPDEAREVFMRLETGGRAYESEAHRLVRGEWLGLQIDALAEIWDSTPDIDSIEGLFSERPTISARAHVWWRTPRGREQIRHWDAVITVARYAGTEPIDQGPFE